MKNQHLFKGGAFHIPSSPFTFYGDTGYPDGSMKTNTAQEPVGMSGNCCFFRDISYLIILSIKVIGHVENSSE